MKHSTLTFSLGAAVALAALAACSSDKATAPGGPSSAEVAANSRADAGQSAAMTLAQLDDNDVASGASVVSGSAAVANTTVNCSGPDAMGWYTCTADLENGLVVVRQIRFWEGTNFGLWWNPGVTDSVNHAWTAIGTVTPNAADGKVFTIADTAAATMSVIRPASSVAIVLGQHSWTGVGAEHHTATWTGDNNVQRIFTHTGSDSIDAVTFQMPRAQNPYPLSGSIIINVQEHFVAGDFSQTNTQRFVFTFDGTHIAKFQDGGLTCDMDLDPPHAVTNCH